MVRQPVFYDLYDYGKYIGRYTPSELMVLLGIRHRQLIGYYNDTGRVYKKRYRMERVEEPICEGWAEEWDYIRIEVLRQLGKIQN